MATITQLSSHETHPQKNIPSPPSSTCDVRNTVDNSFVLDTNGKFYYDERPITPLRTSRHVRVRIVATGLCGSDIHYWQHGRIGRYVVKDPIILGHESSGIIEECGEDVENLCVGDRVAIEPGVGCNTCDVCRKGRYNLCNSMQFAATPPHNGTLSTFYVVPEECCFKLPAHISLREGALVEPLSIAVHCCRLAGDFQGKSVAVFGAGPIGIMCCSVAKAFGASRVVAIDVVESRLVFVKKFGADMTYKMEAGAVEMNARKLIVEAELGTGADIVIDATGAEPCINAGIFALKRGGTFVQAGLGSPDIGFAIGQICDKEAAFKGSFRYGPGDYKLAIDLIRSGRVCLAGLITHEFAFTDAEAAFKSVANRVGIKSIIYGPGIDLEVATKCVVQDCP